MDDRVCRAIPAKELGLSQVWLGRKFGLADQSKGLIVYFLGMHLLLFPRHSQILIYTVCGRIQVNFG